MDFNNFDSITIDDLGDFICKKGNEVVCIPDTMDNRNRRDLQEWIDEGNTPDPYVGPTALENWVEDMASSDAILPRWGEDILDGMPNKLSVAKITLDRLQAKKDLRATKP
jgi:hypothetical protein